LYRAVDSQGNTLDFLLTAKRDAEAAKRFFRKTLQATHTQEPRVINVDKNAACPKAIDEMRASVELSESVELRQNKYLNNLALAGPSVYQAIDSSRHGIPLFQYSTTNLKRIRGDEHVKERTGGRSRKRRCFGSHRIRVSNLRSGSLTRAD